MTSNPAAVRAPIVGAGRRLYDVEFHCLGDQAPDLFRGLADPRDAVKKQGEKTVSGTHRQPDS